MLNWVFFIYLSGRSVRNMVTCIPDCEFKFYAIKKEYVLKELLHTDCSKAVGVDGIHPKFLKLAAESIAGIPCRDQDQGSGFPHRPPEPDQWRG